MGPGNGQAGVGARPSVFRPLGRGVLPRGHGRPPAGALGPGPLQRMPGGRRGFPWRRSPRRSRPPPVGGAGARAAARARAARAGGASPRARPTDCPRGQRGARTPSAPKATLSPKTMAAPLPPGAAPAPRAPMSIPADPPAPAPRAAPPLHRLLPRPLAPTCRPPRLPP